MKQWKISLINYNEGIIMKNTKHPQMIFTDDAWLLSRSAPVVTYKDFEEYIVSNFAGKNGAFWWSVGDHEVWHYETEIGERFGDDYDMFDEKLPSFVHHGTPGVCDAIKRNLTSLIKECGGPLTAISKICKENNIPFFPRVRMNSHYPIDTDHVAYGNFRRNHPELLIGRPGEEIVEGTIEYGIRTGKDFAYPEVRSYMIDMITETFQKFDVDGVELDFCRHPAMFRTEEAYSNRYLMTELIREVKSRLIQTGKEKNRDLKLAVRVPPTLDDSERVGLDVRRWIKEELVDIVIEGIGFIPFDTPVEEFVKATKGTNCLIYGCIEMTRQADPLTLRALAYRWLNAGAAGVYLYNFYTMSPEWNDKTFNELTNLEVLSKLDKRYELAPTGPLVPCGSIGCAFRYASPQTQLPINLHPEYVEIGPELNIDISDQHLDTPSKTNLKEASLTLRLENLKKDDQILVKINGETLEQKTAITTFGSYERLGSAGLFWMSYPTEIDTVVVVGDSIHFPIKETLLKTGNNKIELNLNRTKNTDKKPVTVVGSEISLKFKT